MDQRLKNRWIKALKSGKYPQTRGCLRDKKGYCCLGVLASICGVSDRELSKNGSLASTHPSFTSKIAMKIRDKLVQLNDVDGFSFNDIADRIQYIDLRRNRDYTTKS